MPGALSDVRVIEMGTLLAGPFCGQQLADHGAEVIKIEPPGKGDPMRDWGQEIAEGRLDTKLDSLKRELLSALEVKALPELMQTMVNERVSICLVVSEYGDPLGIATMEDLVETMLGMEIVDESDSHIDMQERARELWRLRANSAGLELGHDE